MQGSRFHSCARISLERISCRKRREESVTRRLTWEQAKEPGQVFRPGDVIMMPGPTPAPPGSPPRLWLVIKPSGERHFIEKEPLGGVAEWAKGLDVTILEYQFTAVVHSRKEIP